MEEKVRTNELKKGDWVELRNGWIAEVWDNQRGDIRMAKVYGHYTEIGSVYSHDIMFKLDPETINEDHTGGTVIAVVEHTKSQKKLREDIRKRGW